MSQLGVAQFIGEFAALQEDGEHPPALLVAGEVFHHFHAQVEQRLQRIVPAASRQAQRQLFRRQAHLVEQVVEQMSLVLEVPIHCSARHPRRLGDLFEAGVRHSPLEEQSFRRIQNRLTSFFGIFFCSSHGARCYTD
ncbi:hypothetical protein D9M73_244450 [compost metagenome]